MFLGECFLLLPYAIKIAGILLAGFLQSIIWNKKGIKKDSGIF